jgi:nucleotide-binding universal stress UspA family protein
MPTMTAAHLAVPVPGAMFQRILVPTDLTERAAKALDLALKLSVPEGSRVTLLHVIETGGLDLDEVKPFYQKLEQKAQRIMSAARERLGKTKTHVVQEIVYGDRAEEIVRFAAAHNIDLILLASHKVNPSVIGRDWGTISYKVGILAQCPVLLVK